MGSRLAWFVGLWWCAGVGGACSRDGLEPVGGGDLRAPRDAFGFPEPEDLSVVVEDLREPEDLAPPPDLLQPDLVQVWDLSGPECSYAFPLAIDFGSVKVGRCSLPVPFRLGQKARLGCGSLKVHAFQIGGPGQVAYSLLPQVKLPFTILPGTEQFYSVQYCPSDQSGDDARILMSTFDGADHTIVLSGKGKP